MDTIRLLLCVLQNAQRAKRGGKVARVGWDSLYCADIKTDNPNYEEIKEWHKKAGFR